MGDENPIHTLGDYSRPSHEGYQNIIELPNWNNMVPLRSDTIRLVQNGCSFHGLWSEDPNQHLNDFLKLVDSLDLDVANRERTCESLSEALTHLKHLLKKFPNHGINLWLQIQIFYDHASFHLKYEIDRAAGGKLRDKNAKESWEIIENSLFIIMMAGMIQETLPSRSRQFLYLKTPQKCPINDFLSLKIKLASY
ncbi:hypothetical protein Tco_0876848 [Tanacetum coccineum]|uniref:MAK10-like protein n=1 Tax=Tanacetum coccineum TaxID=301880 RepID=A0ABQ5BW46_9ASTR